MSRGVLPGDLRRGGDPFCGLDQGGQVGGGGAARPPQESGHGGQLRHLGGVVCRGHVVDGLSLSSLRGRPALGWRRRGTEAASHSWRNTGAISWGPRPQLRPMTSTPSPSSRATRPGGAAGEELPAAVKDEAGQDGRGAVLLGGHHRRLHLVEVAHGLDENQSAPGLLRGPDGGGKAGPRPPQSPSPRRGPQELCRWGRCRRRRRHRSPPAWSMAARTLATAADITWATV